MKECRECKENLNLNGMYAKCGLTGEVHDQYYGCDKNISLEKKAEEKEQIKVVINDTLKQIIVEAHLAGQTVIAGSGEKAYAEKYYNDSFSA